MSDTPEGTIEEGYTDPDVIAANREIMGACQTCGSPDPAVRRHRHENGTWDAHDYDPLATGHDNAILCPDPCHDTPTPPTDVDEVSTCNSIDTSLRVGAEVEGALEWFSDRIERLCDCLPRDGEHYSTGTSADCDTLIAARKLATIRAALTAANKAREKAERALELACRYYANEMCPTRAQLADYEAKFYDGHPHHWHEFRDYFLAQAEGSDDG